MTKDRFVGSLLGTMIGDALGEPIEEWPCDTLNRLLDLRHPNFAEQKTLAAMGLVAGNAVASGKAHYTDDTQMAIGLAQSLIICGEINPEHLARCFAENFQPWRGYGGAAYGVLDALKNGSDWDAPARRIFNGEGSFGNGAAMRVAPLGVYYSNAPIKTLLEAARLQSLPTHTHAHGIAGAQLQALAIGIAAAADPSEELDTNAFLAALTVHTTEPILRKKLDQIVTLLADEPENIIVAQRLGNSIEATLSVPAAIFSFLSRWDSFSDAVLYAVRLGGDADTIGAMTGAIAGAFHGASAIPENWRMALENGDQGVDYVQALGESLYQRWRTQ
jgi:poly(ADP-ribose) glycohydrolase ARH3